MEQTNKVDKLHLPYAPTNVREAFLAIAKDETERAKMEANRKAVVHDRQIRMNLQLVEAYGTQNGGIDQASWVFDVETKLLDGETKLLDVEIKFIDGTEVACKHTELPAPIVALFTTYLAEGDALYKQHVAESEAQMKAREDAYEVLKTYAVEQGLITSKEDEIQVDSWGRLTRDDDFMDAFKRFMQDKLAESSIQ